MCGSSYESPMMEEGLRLSVSSSLYSRDSVLAGSIIDLIIWVVSIVLSYGLLKILDILKSIRTMKN